MISYSVALIYFNFDRFFFSCMYSSKAMDANKRCDIVKVYSVRNSVN